MMKSANWISAIGRIPFIDAPSETPTIIDSVRGVSITRSSPNSAHRPSVARKTPPFLPTSSPRMITDSSRRISSPSVSRMASMNVFVAISAPPSAGAGRAGAAGLVGSDSGSIDGARRRGAVIRAAVAFALVAAAEAPGRRGLGRPILRVHPLHGSSRIGIRGALRIVRGFVDLGFDLGRDLGLELLGQDAGIAKLRAELRQGVLRRQPGQLLGVAVLRLLVVR